MSSLAELWTEGVTIVEIAKRIGVSPAQVSNQARAAGLPARRVGRPRKAGSPADFQRLILKMSKDELVSAIAALARELARREP